MDVRIQEIGRSQNRRPQSAAISWCRPAHGRARDRRLVPEDP
jgi:hypothetical protein